MASKILAVVLALAAFAASAASQLTTGQLATLRADILADGTLAAQPQTGDGAFAIAAAYNGPPAVALVVWRTDAPVKDIFDAINWSLYTPSSALDDATLLLSLTAQQRATQLLAIQTKQLNLQNLTMGRTTVDASKLNVRTGLRDAVISVPAGASGASVSPGGASGATVLTACTRNATRAEKLFVGASAPLGGVTASLMTFEGLITIDDVLAARAN